MHHLVDDKGQRALPPKMRLLSHWNLRDEIKADYADKQNGLAKQRIDPAGDGAHRHPDHPASRHRQPARGLESVHERSRSPPPSRIPTRPRQRTAGVTNAPEPDTRYATLLKTSSAARMADPYSPTGADADRPPLRRGSRDPRGAGQGDARAGAHLAAGARRWRS